MRKIFYNLFAFACLAMVFSSCSQNEELSEQTISGTLLESESSKTISFNGSKITITFDSTAISNSTANSAVNEKTLKSSTITEYGPYYATGTSTKIVSNKKTLIPSGYGYATGAYFCDVYLTCGTITLPTTAITGSIGMPSPAGFTNYAPPSTRGVNWSMSTTASGIKLKWNFYTLRVNYNILGQYYGGRRLPSNVVDANVQIPYTYYAY